jgi:hypothetical protein
LAVMRLECGRLIQWSCFNPFLLQEMLSQAVEQGSSIGTQLMTSMTVKGLDLVLQRAATDQLVKFLQARPTGISLELAGSGRLQRVLLWYIL